MHLVAAACAHGHPGVSQVSPRCCSNTVCFQEHETCVPLRSVGPCEVGGPHEVGGPASPRSCPCTLPSPRFPCRFNAFHPDTRKPMHRECGFIRLEPDTNKVAFVSAQNTGIVEVEEGEVNGQELRIASHSIARISFAKEPHVQQITRKFRLNSEGKLEQTVSMATTTQPMTQHLHITYKKVTP
ncbi:THAP domain containing 4 [Phyllostomus discolor]|uniref:THAP domain containing 4 n=1 Tax=Phyllostomus discolor TaxID=89673 RepID=A0A834EJK7_9CHIR|nr:THAP domain containing 4 [Phyllostomus discolor]